MSASTNQRGPWWWVPSLYYAEGIPYVVVMTVSVIMFKRLGISNTDVALYTSWLYLPWVIKPLWSPFVDLFKTKRQWVIAMQLLIGAGLAGVALMIPVPNFFQWSLALLWLLAFSSATHDIAADGFYMLGLSQHDQAWFVGVRSTFYRLASITGQGLLIMLAGFLESSTGLPPVEVQVDVKPKVQMIAPKPPEPGTGRQRLVASTDVLTMDFAPRTKAETDGIIEQARTWNQSHGFVPAEKKAEAKTESGFHPWRNYVSGPLENTLRRWFPKEVKAASTAAVGNVGVIYFQLAEKVPAGRTVVVNFGRQSGDPSIRLLQGERFTFTSANWEHSFMAVVQLEPKLKEASHATFVARSGNLQLAWSITFFVVAALFLGIWAHHRRALPYPDTDVPTATGAANVFSEFGKTFASFFRKPGILTILAFILLYRFPEAQLVKLGAPFLLDAREAGGLGLSTGAVGFVYGTVGVVALMLGGLCGGFAAAKHGLKYWLPFMVCAIHLPNLAFVYMSYAQPENFLVINACVAVEQFGYGFGFTAYMLYLICVADGPHKTAHYAICTGLMAMGMMVPGMFSGWLQEIIGYQKFFVWVMIAAVPSFVVSFLIKVDPNFGRKAPAQA